MSGKDVVGAVLKAASGRLSGAEWLVLLPGLTLLAYWVGGEPPMIALAIGAPVLLALSSLMQRKPAQTGEQPLTGFATEPILLDRLDRILADGTLSGRTTACFVVLFDEADALLDRHGRAARDIILRQTAERLSLTTREGDIVARLQPGGFSLVLAPVLRFDLETAIQLAVRLQAAATAPLALDGLTLHPSVSVGFCLAQRSPGPTAKAMLEAALIAADEALRNGPGAIRAFLPEMTARRADRATLRTGLEQALDEGQIRPWFQPQVSTDTGEITGCEALARWHHPDRGILSPTEFLPLVEDAGLSARLGEVILFGALSALSRWDKAGFGIARVAVNFSASELRNPRLAEKLKWELDRFSLPPNRLTIEVLETVAARFDDDIILSNLAQLSALGCGIDLDDFGTGQASIANIRRFAVTRIKIDRSFVARADTDPAQKRMVAAILSMAERLGLETVAEGVETPGEHATIAQLGCTHAQGFGIARPMTVEESFGWIERHRSGLARVAQVGRVRR